MTELDWRAGVPKYKNLPPSQSSVFRKMPVQNVFNFVHNYEVTPCFPDHELGQNSGFMFW